MNRLQQNTVVEPYLFFNGKCEEALEFYKKAIGAEVPMLMRFKDSPEPAGCGAPVPGEKIMHANMIIGQSSVMVSDGCCEENQGFQGFALTLSVSDDAEADRRFAALAEGGTVQMPLEKTFFAKKFGMVTDKFGVAWMIIIPAEQPTTPVQSESMAV